MLHSSSFLGFIFRILYKVIPKGTTMEPMGRVGWLSTCLSGSGSVLLLHKYTCCVRLLTALFSTVADGIV